MHFFRATVGKIEPLMKTLWSSVQAQCAAQVFPSLLERPPPGHLPRVQMLKIISLVCPFTRLP